MMDTYDGLKTTVADYLARDDLTAQIPDFIKLAEARHRREIRYLDMIRRVRTNMSTQYIKLPQRFLQMRELRLFEDDEDFTLEAVTPARMTEMRSRYGGRGYRPRYYAVHEELSFDVVPEKTYLLEMVYYAFFPALDATTNTTNLMLQKHPDVYLYGALMAAEPFLQNDERLQVWDALYKSAVEGIKISDARKRQGATLVARVHGVTP
jgi:hypothetical protein